MPDAAAMAFSDRDDDTIDLYNLFYSVNAPISYSY